MRELETTDVIVEELYAEYLDSEGNWQLDAPEAEREETPSFLADESDADVSVLTGPAREE